MYVYSSTYTYGVLHVDNSVYIYISTISQIPSQSDNAKAMPAADEFKVVPGRPYIMKKPQRRTAMCSDLGAPGIYPQMAMDMHTYTYIYIYTYMYVCMYIYINTHTHI